jgi:TonB family protein
MYFNFDDSHPETPTIERAISAREGWFLSIFVHAGLALLILFGPRLPFVQHMLAQAQAERARLAELAQQRALDQRPTFVFVRPRVDTPASRPPPRAELSDKDRMAQAPERAPNPTNPLPYSRGNSPERVEPTPDSKMAKNEERRMSAAEAAAEAARASRGADPKAADSPSAVPPSANGTTFVTDGRDAPSSRGRSLAGAIGDALRNADKYAPESFNNPQGGGGEFGPAIQFDTKGVEFGPWVRRFVAQVKRNWFIPYAAMVMKGHVVLTFNVHRDGHITDLTVLQPSSVDAFNNAAYNALAASNPTQPLPPEYPSESAFFTVTFYYNENPGGGGGE